jgi:hypothetical protein
MRFLCVFVLATVALSPVASFGIHDALDVIGVAKDVVIWIAKAWNIIEGQVEYADVPFPLLDKTERKLFGKIDLINSKLNQLSAQVEAVGTNTISMMLNNLPERIRLELRLNDLLNYHDLVGNSFQTMQKYTTYRDYLEKSTLKDYADNVVSHDPSSVRGMIETIYTYVVPSGKGINDRGILQLLSKSLKEVEGDMLCNAHQSPQQVLFSLYNAIALTELKGYTMIQFAYMLKRLYGEGNFTTEAEIARERFQQRTNRIIQTVKIAMESASKDLWKCDPKRHISGDTYVEVTQLLQGYIQNEVDLNSEGTCRENCAEYSYTKSHGCYQNLWCKRQRRCHGKIINCKYVDSDMWVCPADSQSRRYEYVEYENGRVLGRKQSCRRGTTKVDSWWRWLFWHCSYCFCLCDEQGVHSDRYVNLRQTIADVSNNRVVTGLRFVKHNRIIHLQIQEGKLLPRGNIDLTTVHWVPVEDYKITDKNTINGQDYHTLTWEKRAVDLDDLVADDGYVVTGVRFKMIGSHLNFEIYITPFDFETGQLIDPATKSLYKDNPNTDSSLQKPRTRVKLTDPDVSTRSPSPSLPDSKTDQYVEFTNTDMDRDAAQTTVPFLDAQPVDSLQPVPLSGAGIYHKGHKNFGGFIAPKIITYDYSKHLQAAFPEEEPDIN